MSRLTDLIRRVEQQDPALARDLEKEVHALASRRAFGLNFERHVPETVELPGRRVRRGDKVRFRAPRGEPDTTADSRIWVVTRLEGTGEYRIAHLTERSANPEPETTTRPVEDVVVVAEFRDSIYPGLRSTGAVERGGDRPFHTVINGENYHALEALLFAYEGKVDCIYIDPPYNTRDKDWKYNNDYVDSDDAYRHSKWLAMMERRLRLAKRLLNPVNSVLIVTIDEKEYLRLGLMLEQVFLEARVQMVSITISPRSTSRASEFSRVDEYAFFVFIGSVEIGSGKRSGEDTEVRWLYLRRTQRSLIRGSRPRQFYPIYVDRRSEKIVHIGNPMSMDDRMDDVPVIEGATPVFPVAPDGTALIWGLTGPSFQQVLNRGFVRVTVGNEHQPYTIAYLSTEDIKRVDRGEYRVAGTRPDGSKIVVVPGGKAARLSTVWRESRHDAGAYGTTLLRSLIPGRSFPFPKSLYAVEDTIGLIISNKPEAVILDFFAGSATTAHAVMRLNRQDGGRRRSIMVTNNEVSDEEARALRTAGHRPGDPEWEALGICEYITKPRIRAAITGLTPNGDPIKGDYKFTDEFPMAEGFEANAEFFNLTYEDPDRVRHELAFTAIAPLLWMRAGSEGRRIECPNDSFDVADTYAILFKVDAAADFADSVTARPDLRLACIVTDDERQYQMIADTLPAHIETMRLYEAYLRTFAISPGDD